MKETPAPKPAERHVIAVRGTAPRKNTNAVAAPTSIPLPERTKKFSAHLSHISETLYSESFLSDIFQFVDFLSVGQDLKNQRQARI
mmetsp:Transcript_2760/g.6388  ORF Transcript_2760/g.6388 Transcript_2760/m.6388 type:complete len:86 (+) Transcript_2760:462-719(+)